MDLAAPSREALPAPRRPLPGESAAEYELAVLAYLRQAVPRVPQFARCTALMGRELPDRESAPGHFAKVAFWADAVVELVPAQERPAALDRAFVLHLAFDVFGRAWKACKWAQLQTTADKESNSTAHAVPAHSVSGDAPHRTRTHAAGAPYDRSRRGQSHTTVSNLKQTTADMAALGAMHSMTLDATAVLKGALASTAALGDIDVDALCATFAAASLDPSPSPVASSFPEPTPDNVKLKRKRRKTRPRLPDSNDDPLAVLRAHEALFRRFGRGLDGHSDTLHRWKPQPRPRSRPDPFTDFVL